MPNGKRSYSKTDLDINTLSTKLDQVLVFIEEHKEAHKKLEIEVAEIQKKKLSDELRDWIKSVTIWVLSGLVGAMGSYIWLR